MNTVRHALVLGLGRSGCGAARLLLARGSAVTALDSTDSPGLRVAARSLEAAGARVSLGMNQVPPQDFDLAVVSPGIPLDAALPAAVTARGIPLISELELGWRELGGRVLAVTGSNGKSTALTWAAAALRKAGRQAVLAGNYGVSLCEEVLAGLRPDWWLLEVSSFQLEAVRDFRPDIGVLLNLLPNHLDRHGTMDQYLAFKARLFGCQREGDLAVAPHALLPRVQALAPDMAGRWCTFGDAASDYPAAGNEVRCPGGKSADLSGTPFANPVMMPTAAAMVAALAGAGVPPAVAAQAAGEFTPLPHRLQNVGAIGGVAFINDSKATNLAALSAALRIVPPPIRLIAGGLAKETDFNIVKDVLANTARQVYLMGKCGAAMAAAWQDVVPCVLCGTLERAVRQAWQDARPGETVLLAPGGASYDQFENFEHRGREFAGLVTRLQQEQKK